MDNIKIIRFKDGIDVICNLIQMKGEYTVENPMYFEIKNTNLVMQHWLPLAMIKENKVTIKNEDILCIFEPSNTFSEYYSDAVEKITNVLNGKEDTEDMDEMEEIMDAMEQLQFDKDLVVH